MTEAGLLTNARLSSIFILTVDHARMTRFYTEVLGLTLLYHDAGAFAFFGTTAHGPQIALYPGRDPSPSAAGPNWFLVFDVPALEPVRERLMAQGVEVTEIAAVPGGRAAQFRDPEDNLIEIHEPV